MSERDERDLHFQAEVLEQLERCGVKRSQVIITYEDHLQDYDITIDGPAEDLDDEQYAAVAETASSRGYIVNFNDEAARIRLWRATERQFGQKARDWLEERGKLEGLPMFDAAQSDLAVYARKLELHLGLDPGSMLEVRTVPGLGVQQISLKSVGNSEKHLMALNGIKASNLRECGVITGIIGGK